jgi:hypothetical protein
MGKPCGVLGRGMNDEDRFEKAFLHDSSPSYEGAELFLLLGGRPPGVSKIQPKEEIDGDDDDDHGE